MIILRPGPRSISTGVLPLRDLPLCHLQTKHTQAKVSRDKKKYILPTLRWVPACAVVTQTDIALYLRGKEGNRTAYAEERTEDLEKYGILVVGQDQDRPGDTIMVFIFYGCLFKISHFRWWL